MNRLLLAALSLILLVGCNSPDITTMDDETLLKHMSDVAYQKSSKVDYFYEIEEPYRTVAIIFAAQGIIDNGGFVYFFESDWEGQPPYSLFIDAYERIGRVEAAKALREAADSFGFPEPEKHEAKRQAYIERNYDEDQFEVETWNDCICGDEQVWADLAAWVRKNRAP